MTMFAIDPKKITVRKGLERYRKDMGSIEELAASILQYGQLQPIIVTKERELIDGGRRLAACLYIQTTTADHKIFAVYKKDVTDNDMLRVVELEANIQRKDFSPAEKKLAIDDVHRIKMQEAGEEPGQVGREKKWNVKKTAAILGISSGAVSTALQQAPVIRANPELKNSRTAGEITNKVRKIKAHEQAEVAAKEVEEKLAKAEETKFSVVHREAAVFMASLEDASVDLIITDPPYMLNINSLRRTPAELATYNDAKSECILNSFLQDAARVLNNKGALYMFVSTELFSYFKDQLTTLGMAVYPKELIWLKATSGQTNNPDKWPGDVYEKILFARKPGHVLKTEGMINLIKADKVRNPTHQAEKPVALIENLLFRSAYRNNLIVDPFMGSGTVIEAAIKNGYRAKGCDKEEWCVNLTKERMLRYVK